MAKTSIDDARAISERMVGRSIDRFEPLDPPRGDTSYNFRLWIGDDPMLLKIMRRADLPMGAPHAEGSFG